MPSRWSIGKLVTSDRTPARRKIAKELSLITYRMQCEALLPHTFVQENKRWSDRDSQNLKSVDWIVISYVLIRKTKRWFVTAMTHSLIGSTD